MVGGRVRDLGLLDNLDAQQRRPFVGEVWRVCREGRDPTSGFASHTRWCDGTFDVLYTALERDGAVAEIYAHLCRQPVFPSRVRWFAHRLRVSVDAALELRERAALAPLGVDVARYEDFDYATTQPVAEAAHFLGFDALLAPSARWQGLNLVIFTDRLGPDRIEVLESEAKPIDFAAWRRARKA
jgi:hypothetical protein